MTDPLYLRGSIFWPERGRIRIVGQPIVRPYAFNPVSIDRINRVTNPSFEVNTTGWGFDGTSLTRDTAQHWTGVASARLDTTTGGDIFESPQFAGSASTVYTASMYVRGTGSARLALACAPSGEFATSATVTLTNTWQRLTVTATSPVGTTNIYSVPVQLTTGTQSMWVDGVMLEQSAVVGDYFDGATANAVGYTYAWSGTAHASSSIRTALSVDYQDTINSSSYPGTIPFDLIRPMNFLAGKVKAYFPYGKEFGISTTPTLFQGGRIQILSPGLPAVGAFSEFAVYPTTAKDPAEFYAESFTSGTSGAVGAAWTRHNAIFAVGRGRNGYKNVSYLAVGAQFTGVAASGKQYLGKVQTERAPIDGGTYPTPYTKAREVQTVVSPDRLNYSLNPAFAIDTTNWAVSGGGTLTRIAQGSGFTGQVAITTTSSAVITHTVQALIIGRRYTISTRVSATDRTDVGIAVTGGTVIAKRTYAESSMEADGYRVMYIIFDATASTVTLTLTPSATSATPNVLVYKTLVEESAQLHDYFDGSTSADCLWETGGVTGKTRSYYYKNRAERNATLKRVLTANVPMGIGIADPQYAVLPA